MSGDSVIGEREREKGSALSCKSVILDERERDGYKGLTCGLRVYSTILLLKVMSMVMDGHSGFATFFMGWVFTLLDLVLVAGYCHFFFLLFLSRETWNHSVFQ